MLGMSVRFKNKPVLPRVAKRLRGAAAAEYAVSLAFIIVAIGVAVSLFDLTAVFPALVAKIKTVIG